MMAYHLFWIFSRIWLIFVYILWQSFAKSLLDVADNLGRASSHVKSGFSKIDESKDTTGAVPLMKTLLEGVEMTEKQLAEVKCPSLKSFDIFFLPSF